MKPGCANKKTSYSNSDSTAVDFFSMAQSGFSKTSCKPLRVQKKDGLGCHALSPFFFFFSSFAFSSLLRVLRDQKSYTFLHVPSHSFTFPHVPPWRP
jgi:hypothetical protein